MLYHQRDCEGDTQESDLQRVGNCSPTTPRNNGKVGSRQEHETPTLLISSRPRPAYTRSVPIADIGICFPHMEWTFVGHLLALCVLRHIA